MLQIKAVKINYEMNPVGIEEVPQFSWVLESTERNVKQSAYHLQIALDKGFEETVFDSGKTDSNKSVHITPNKLQIKSATKYYARVKVWANKEESDWSAVAYFVTGLRKKDWQAKFVSAKMQEEKENSKGTYVRSTFCVKGKIKEAFAFTTALGIYEFYLNGRKVGEDLLTPGWTSYNRHLLYQTYDVRDCLKDGENGIGASLGAGWYKGVMGFEHRRNHYGERTAFLCQIVIRYEDGSEETICTDENWVGHDSPVEFAEIYDGEIYNAGKEISGWAESGEMDTSWKCVSEVEYDKKYLRAQSGCRVQRKECLKAKELLVTPGGDTVIDFGQNMSGLIQVTAYGKQGDIIELQCFETLDKDGNVYLDNLRGAKETLRYTFGREGKITYSPSFTFMGFRYAKVVSFPGEPTLKSFAAHAIHSNMEETGTFECSNQDINQLWHNIRWGMKSNFVDVPTDCPQRDERLGWTGDAQIFARTATYLMNTYSFFRKWLNDLAADQLPGGGVPHVIPDILTKRGEEELLADQKTHSAAAWADAAVIVPWNLYLCFGDKQILAEQYESMKGWIDFMKNRAEDYIWNYGLQFGDWVALDAEEGSYFGATPNDLTCTAYFAYSTDLFVKASRVLGKEEEARQYGELYNCIVDKFQRTFFDSDGRMTAQTQTAHIIALYFKLVPQQYRKQTVEKLKELLAKEDGHLVTGFVGTPYFCHALSENGALEEAYELLLKDDFPSWLYQVKQGATTIWEHWDGIKPDGSMWSPDMNSFNHYAYGAIGEWLYRVVAGIEIDEAMPGYEHSIIHPHFGGGLEFVQASCETVYGKLSVRWEETEEARKVFLHIPANTTATIRLDGKQILESDGLKFELEKDSQIWEAEAGSGDYVVVLTKLEF
ncbi:alpha-L-rhamnosidase [Konateibacter massiliensis]|uniref:alpha-L-rhamnosidase n=1 Tax=Konateibacter massiliensis TaxID=2002841 RepID=UPI000C154EFC|nr:alpha-L-rhamnosidase [Konateibacter massiliensis]